MLHFPTSQSVYVIYGDAGSGSIVCYAKDGDLYFAARCIAMWVAEHHSGCISIAASVVHATSTAATERAATAPASVAIAVTSATTAPASVTITAAGVSRQCGGGGVSSCLLLSSTTSWTLYSLPFRAVSPFYELFFHFFQIQYLDVFTVLGCTQ